MSYLSRNGYYPRLYINNNLIPDSSIDGSTITVRRSEGDSAQMVVTLRAPSGTQTLTAYQGLSIFLNVQNGLNNYRVFTGIIDIDEYDILKETITLRCSDDRANRINAIPNYVAGVGYFSQALFGVPKDPNTELENRLSTIPYAFDFDVFGNPQLTPWAAKSTPDFTLGNSQVYRREPSVEKTYRSQIINNVSITVDYNFQRLYHKEVAFNWENNVSACDFLLYGHSLPTRELIRQAVNAAGWPTRYEITFTDVYPSGFYNCEGVTMGWIGTTTTGVNYNTKKYQVVNGVKTLTNIKDAAGNDIVKTAEETTVNYNNIYCIGASWLATKRWAQNIKETYTLTVTAPQSTAQYGIVSAFEQMSLTSDYDTSNWENYKQYEDVPDGESVTYLIESRSGTSSSSYYKDKDENRGELNLGFNAIINKARTTILKSHRQTKVIFQTDIWPAVDLIHTVSINATRLTAKGKVFSVEHVIIPGTGEAYTNVVLSVSTSVGSASDTTVTIPAQPSYDPLIVVDAITLGAHYGVDVYDSDSSKWNGHIGNKWVTERQNLFRTQFPEMFIVDTPDIEEGFRENATLVSSGSYNVAIPNDTLTITFNGKPS